MDWNGDCVKKAHLGHGREINIIGRPLADFGLNRNQPVMLPDNGIADREAEPQTFLIIGVFG